MTSASDNGVRKCKIIFSVFCILLFGFIIFIATFIPSVKYVKYNQYALKQNRFSQVDLSVVYGPGRYFFSPMDELIYFPSTMQLVKIDSAVFDNLGQEAVLNIVFYYQLPRANIAKIYHEFSMNYEDRIINIVKTTVKNIAPKYSVDDYVINRDRVEDDFAENVHHQLVASIGIDIQSLYFRLLDVKLQDSIIASSLISAIELQNNMIQTYSQNVAVIEYETNSQVAVITAQINLVLANSNILANQVIENSKSEADAMVMSARALGIQTCLDALNVTTPEIRSQFIKLAALLDGSNPKIFSGTFDLLVNG